MSRPPSRTTRLLSATAVAAVLSIPVLATVGWAQSTSAPAAAQDKPADKPAESKGPQARFLDRIFERLDTDKDGSITKAEFDTARDRIFSLADQNGDGVVTPVELRRARADLTALWTGRGGSLLSRDANSDNLVTKDEFMAVPASTFDRFDLNRDGKLDRSEIAAARDTMRAEIRERSREARERISRYQRGDRDDRRDARDDDRDHRGRHFRDRDERRDSRADDDRRDRGPFAGPDDDRREMRGRRGEERAEGRRGRAGGQIFGSQRIWRMIDTDGDGIVSKAEFAAATDKFFAALDADHDNKVVRDEAAKGPAALRSAFGPK